jgi:hypothetical protein
MLTQSSFGKGGGNKIPSKENNPATMGPSGQGYISDYYLNNNGQKLVKRPQLGEGTVASGEDRSEREDNIDTMNNGGAVAGGKISNKKFFKSKIDFMAPIKSLRGQPGGHAPGGPGDPLLSDDTYYEPPP